MTGMPEFNYPAFNQEAARLRGMGYIVENPAENPAQDSWQAYMRVAIAQLVRCDEIAMLRGWSKSEGARIERDIAQKLGMVVTGAAG